ncbi:Methyltransferase-like protein 21B [Apophysomyces ossiformis]|uniref:Methyltransferase-like protein 21B n=1 Tax=Apophysomyces ossiformis TaxID=679940 RepID=A0A8H7BNR0_9FUNG|nr:Methyltransferase-like protein 21B [Apophysomyces ossiformis]
MYQVETRPLQLDEWDATDSNTALEWPGFHRSGLGGLEYRIVKIAHGGKQQYLTKTKYLQIVSTFDPMQTFHALPLALGPLKVVDGEKKTSMNGSGWGTDVQSTVMHRAFSLDRNSHDRRLPGGTLGRRFLIKEGWSEGTPGKIWDSALVLSDMFSNKLSREPQSLGRRHVIDLSAGTGCCGLLIASICQGLQEKDQPQVTLTDLPQALGLIQHNKDINMGKKPLKVSIERLRWGHDGDARKILGKGQADIIIASDVLYEPACFGYLVKTLEYLSTPGKTVIYLGYKRRGLNDEEEANFFNLCSVGFHIHLIQESQGEAEAVDWERRYGYMMKNDDVDGKGWLGSYVQNIRESTSLGEFKDLGLEKPKNPSSSASTSSTYMQIEFISAEQISLNFVPSSPFYTTERLNV